MSYQVLMVANHFCIPANAVEEAFAAFLTEATAEENERRVQMPNVRRLNPLPEAKDLKSGLKLLGFETEDWTDDGSVSIVHLNGKWTPIHDRILHTLGNHANEDWYIELEGEDGYLYNITAYGDTSQPL